MGMFSRLDPHVQRVSGWLTVAGFALSGTYTLLAGAAPYFADWSWAGLILLGTASALATLFIAASILAVGAYGFRLIRPLPAPLPDLRKAIDAQKPDVELIRDDALTRLEAKLREVEASMLKAIDRIEAGASLSTDYTRRQIASLYQALAAIGHRETLSELGEKIEEEADKLAQPTTGEVRFDENQWEKWEAKQAKWRLKLRHWCTLASSYSEGIEAKILDTPEDRYRETGQARIEQFPNPEAFFAYKTFWILYKNWREHREEAERDVYAHAFAGATTNEKPIFPGERSRPDD